MPSNAPTGSPKTSSDKLDWLIANGHLSGGAALNSSEPVAGELSSADKLAWLESGGHLSGGNLSVEGQSKAAYPPGQRPEGDLDLGEVVSNIPRSAVKLVNDTASALWPGNWVNIGKGMGNLALGGYENLTGADINLPGVKERAGLLDATGDAVHNAYGNWNNFKGTLEQDPLAPVSLLAAAGTGGGSLAAKAALPFSKSANMANKVTQVSKAIDPLNFMTNMTKGVLLNPIGRGIVNSPSMKPEHLYNQVAKLSAPKGKDLQKILWKAVDKKIEPTYAGYQRLEALAQDVEFKIDSIIKAVPEGHRGVPVSQVLSGIDSLKGKAKKDSAVDSNRDFSQINAVTKAWLDPILARHHKKHNYNPETTFWPPNQTPPKKPPEPMISVRDLHELKKNLYIESKYGLARGVYEPSASAARKTMAKSAKELVEQNVSDGSNLAAKNKDWGELIDLANSIKPRADVNNRLNSMNLGIPLAIEAGEALGGTPMAAIAGLLSLGGRQKIPLAFKMNDWKKGMNPTALEGLKSQITKNKNPWLLSNAPGLLSRYGLIQGDNINEMNAENAARYGRKLDEQHPLMGLLQNR